MVEIPLPSLDDAVSRGKKIADSPALSLIFKGSMIVACGFIVYFSKGTYETVQQSQITLVSHTSDISTLQSTANKIEGEVSTDHDWLTIIKSEVEGPSGLIEQVAKLWQRPAMTGNKTQQ